MGRNKLVMPFVKWVGGKRQLLGALEGLLSVVGIREYCEPFLGGGAVLFSPSVGQSTRERHKFFLRRQK